MQHAVRVLDDYHYVVQVSIPWKEIGIEPRERHTVLGVDFAVNGRDPETGAYDYFDWCGLKVFHDPSGLANCCLRVRYIGQQLPRLQRMRGHGAGHVRSDQVKFDRAKT